jgi:hypothetical protein
LELLAASSGCCFFGQILEAVIAVVAVDGELCLAKIDELPLPQLLMAASVDAVGLEGELCAELDLAG